mmetsp:Transcript_24768/g.84972  ORF Transcript_24768/g.84972 Transcript_24768/m.84972 type:complete len:223 (-) Transcript_24768:23-691(-)
MLRRDRLELVVRGEDPRRGHGRLPLLEARGGAGLLAPRRRRRRRRGRRGAARVHRRPASHGPHGRREPGQHGRRALRRHPAARRHAHGRRPRRRGRARRRLRDARRRRHEPAGEVPLPRVDADGLPPRRPALAPRGRVPERGHRAARRAAAVDGRARAGQGRLLLEEPRHPRGRLRARRARRAPRHGARHARARVRGGDAAREGAAGHALRQEAGPPPPQPL